MGFAVFFQFQIAQQIFVYESKKSQCCFCAKGNDAIKFWCDKSQAKKYLGERAE